MKAAGLQPCRLYKRIEDKTLLMDWGEAIRKKGGLLSRNVYRQGETIIRERLKRGLAAGRGGKSFQEVCEEQARMGRRRRDRFCPQIESEGRVENRRGM